MSKQPILVVDDEKGIRDQLYWALNETYQVHLAADAATALDVARQKQPAVVTLDLALTGAEDEREGFDLIGRILEINDLTKIIMVTAHGQKENALACIERGAYDFFSKPIDVDALKVVIDRALHLHQLEAENRHLKGSLSEAESYEDIIGSSEAIHRVFDFIRTVASSDYTVLITGESGTGKELVARAIHRRSNRREEVFVTINCGAIPETLLESELFGFEKGAFTDAVAQRIGRLEQANRGTVFLDEIGELSPKLQVKLLRFMEDHRIERLGGNKPIDLDVRILAASNRKLDREAESGQFREDLFYRLSVLQVELPPLRDRGEDVILLANYFLARFSQQMTRGGLKFSAEALRVLSGHAWPGNVRELENKVKRAVILAKTKTLGPADLALGATAGKAAERDSRTLQEVREQAEREHLRRALLEEGWNISRVSRRLATSRTTLYELIDKYRLQKGQGS